MNIGTIHYSVFENPDSSLYYTEKATPILIEFKDYKNLAYNYNNQAQQYKLKGDYIEAIKLYQKADSIPLNENISKTKIVFYTNLSETYLLNKDYKNASYYLDKLNKLKDSTNDTKQNIAISEIKEQYDNEKLRADNLESESKRKQNKNLLIGALAVIAFGSITAFLLQKNTRKKQKLAEQEKALETQKLATVLKEQELVSIDAMIEGQEKERQRIANDLHDDLGGLMATVKLHFNVLKEKQTPELFDKTTNLLDEAYQKIRSIAHTKNSGVIAKQGLLKAVQNMADKISVSNTIQVDVIDHGLENRLENSLELTIFRIIQELITNVIKHAHATKAHIHLTNHDDALNIMIEDNGKGFNPSQITTKNKGMGISSIDKRVAHLQGTMTIESELGTANDGEALLEIVEKKQPNVVLTDIRMPKMDGIEATKQIKKKHPKINILAFTMFEQTEAIQQMIEAGASGYILKNSSLDEVHNAILAVAKGEKYFDANINTNVINAQSSNKIKGVLTKRQTEILQLIGQGKTSREIAGLQGKGELMRYALEKKYKF